MVDVESIDPRIEKIRQLGGAQDSVQWWLEEATTVRIPRSSASVRSATAESNTRTPSLDRISEKY